MTIELRSCRLDVEEIDVKLGAPRTTIEEWLVRWNSMGFMYLLAWGVEGVTWGRVEGSGSTPRLITSEDLLPRCSPALSADLQELRLFTDDAPGKFGGEIQAWRNGRNWRAVLVRDSAGNTGEGQEAWIRDSAQVLFGSQSVGATSDGFTVVGEGHGLYHAPPVELTGQLFSSSGNHRPLSLRVREYVTVSNGVARVTRSRLAGISLVERSS